MSCLQALTSVGKADIPKQALPAVPDASYQAGRTDEEVFADSRASATTAGAVHPSETVSAKRPGSAFADHCQASHHIQAQPKMLGPSSNQTPLGDVHQKAGGIAQRNTRPAPNSDFQQHGLSPSPKLKEPDHRSWNKHRESSRESSRHSSRDRSREREHDKPNCAIGHEQSDFREQDRSNLDRSHSHADIWRHDSYKHSSHGHSRHVSSHAHASEHRQSSRSKSHIRRASEDHSRHHHSISNLDRPRSAHYDPKKSRSPHRHDGAR